MFYDILSIWETNLQCSNRMSCVYKFPLLSLQSKVKNIFHTFMATTQTAVLTTASNLIFQLSAAVLIISEQHTKMGNVRVM